MKESELMEAIKRYLEDPTDDYAIMITGAWGCGKTHFVENRLKTEIGADGWRVVRISMFGVQSEEVFYDRLLTGIFSSVGRGTEDGTGKRGKGTERFGNLFRGIKKKIRRFEGLGKDAGLSAIKTAMRKTGVQLNVGSKSVVELLLREKSVVVLDDLERCLLDETRLLGLMDAMIESQGRKVILLANERELERALESNGENAKQSYLAAKEKLVWHVYPFDPDICELSQELFGSRIANLMGVEKGEGGKLVNRFAMGALGNGVNNIRLLKRAMSICDVLENTQFFKQANDDSRRASTLESVLSLSLKAVSDAAMGRDDGVPDSDLNFNTEYVQQFVEASQRERLDALPFIENYLLRGQVDSGEEIEKSLEAFLMAYHPSGEKAERANAAISKWQYRTFRNSDAPSMVSDMMESIVPPSDGGLGFERYRDALLVIADLGARLPESGADEEAAVEKMKIAVDADLEAARGTIGRGLICWQTAGFPEELTRVAAIDELREYILDQCLRSSIRKAQMTLHAPGCFQPGEIISSIKAERDVAGKTRILLSLDPRLAARRLSDCSVDGLYSVHELILSGGARGVLHFAEGSGIREWLVAFSDAIDPSGTDEIAVKDMLGYIQQAVWKMVGGSKSDPDRK